MNPVAWVTGGGTGIGRAVAKALLQRRYCVVISGRRAQPLEATVNELKSTGDIMALAGDVGDGAQVRALHQAIVQKWGAVSLLVNNAGINPVHRFEETSFEEFQDVMRVNLWSVVHCIQAVLPAMREKNEGMIVNVSSVYGKWASHRSSAYSASKYAVAGLTDSLRQDLGDSGIHVMGVYPGFIRTDMTAPYVIAGSLRERLGKSPDDMARAILRGLDSRRAQVFYPFYTWWFTRLHDFFPKAAEALARRMIQ